MKKIEEIYEIEKLPADLAEHYETVLKYLNDMEVLTGEAGFGNAYELEEKDWDRYCELKNGMVQTIVRIIRKQDREFDFQVLETFFQDSDFWDEIKNDVSRQTKEFLFMQPLRGIGAEERKIRYQDVFRILYEEHETIDYMSRELELDEKIATLYARVLRFSEDLILNFCISNRLFRIRFYNYCGLDAGDADFLWKLYSENRDRLEKIALKNRLNDINCKVSRLITQMKDVEERLDFLEYMMLSDEEPGSNGC